MDATALMPTVMAAVPVILDSVREGECSRRYLICDAIEEYTSTYQYIMH